jgi:hypothetical protein
VQSFKKKKKVNNLFLHFNYAKLHRRKNKKNKKIKKNWEQKRKRKESLTLQGI